MNQPGGRPTPGLEAVTARLAEGADAAEVARDLLRAAALATSANQALALGFHGDDPVERGSYGIVSACLRATTAAALASGRPERKSDPTTSTNAGAIPVFSRGRLVGAIGVGGPADALDPGPLDTAAAVLALLVDRPGTSPTRAPDVLAPLAAALDESAVAAAVTDVLAELTPAPSFVCLPSGGRLQVARFTGLDRERLAGLVGSPEFVGAVRDWRDSPDPAPSGSVLADPAGGSVVACVPVGGAPAVGVVALVVPAPEGDAALATLEQLSPHVAAARARVADRAAAARADHQVDAVVQASPGALLVVDAAGALARMNPAAAELFGLSGSFDVGRPAQGRLGSSEVERLLLEGTTPGEVEVGLGTPPRAHKATVSRIYDGGELTHSVLAVEDVSTGRASEQRQADFVAVIGHELRTPLTVAKGFLETVLARDADLDPAQRADFLTTSLRQSERLEDLINDLLFLSTERPRSGLHHEQVDVMAVALKVADRLGQRHDDRTIDCIPMGETEAFVDQRYLTHALRHLVDNALKYSEGPVRIEVAGQGATVEVAVVDQGSGIFSGDLERLMQPFEQKDGSSTRAQGGTGLGLYVSRRLVEAMGGRLDCDSRLGQGSRFSFHLPRRGAAPPDRHGSLSHDGARDDATL